MTSEEDIIAMLDSLTEKEVSRIKLQVENANDEGDSKGVGNDSAPIKEYHHGRCDVGSPWARGCAFDVLE